MSFRRPPSDVERMTSLRVGNLPFKTHSEDLLPLFEKYGDVGDVYLPLERGSGRSRGFAFVRYYDKRDAEDAMDALNGRTYDGRDLRITIDAGRPSGGGKPRDRDRDYRRRSRSRSYDRRRSRSGSRDRDRRKSRSRSRSRDRRSRDRSDSRDRRSSRRDRSSSGRGRSKSGSKSRSRSR